MKTLREELKQRADKANTATEITNRIVKDCLEVANNGDYCDLYNIPAEVREEVLTNLQNKFTSLKVEKEVDEYSTWFKISWED